MAGMSAARGHGASRPGQAGSGPDPVPQVSVRLLGGFRAERAGGDGPAIRWQRRSARSLVKLLAAVPEHALHREQVLDILWPGAGMQPALNSLGKALHAARRAFEPELPRRQDSAYLRQQDGMIALSTEHVAVDADRFERLAQDALRCGKADAYEYALAAYGGEFLPEDRYADWCAGRRSFLADLRVRLLEVLAEALRERGAHGDSAQRLRAVLQYEPAREPAHRQLMRLYAEMGKPDEAIRQFHLCQEALRRELDLAPQSETVDLYREILARRGRRPVAAGEVAGRERTPPAAPAPGGPFIGRRRILQYLAETLTRSDEGKPGLILVGGEPGAGKTRLLAEFAATAARQGAAVLWGGGGAPGGQLTTGPVAAALERYAASRPEGERGELACRYPALARMVPSLGTAGCPLQPAGGPAGYQLDLGPAIARFVTDLAARQPVLLAVGDLDDIDPASLDLLRYLAQVSAGRPLLTAAAVRDGTQAGPVLRRAAGALMHEHRCAKIVLQCLSRRDCDALVRGVLPAGLATEPLLGRIYAQTAGNPLLAVELARELSRSGERGAAGTGPAAVPVPPRVRALTAERLAAVGEPASCLVMLAAAASRAEVSLAELRAGVAVLVPAAAGPVFLDALDRALELHFLEERGGGYSFRQPLVRSAVWQNLPRHRREQLRAALAAFGEVPAPRLAVANAG